MERISWGDFSKRRGGKKKANRAGMKEVPGGEAKPKNVEKRRKRRGQK